MDICMQKKLSLLYLTMSLRNPRQWVPYIVLQSEVVTNRYAIV